ncbi:MAG: RecX family transcriptional regulator [Acidobacteria bacterium]|nr:MAG: RecX family transcriptional regulator [Acidobacteriota bacterium]
MAWKKSTLKKTYTEDSLYEYAVGALGRRMRTVAELKRLMRTRAGHQTDCDALVEAVTARLKEQRYLNDTNYASSYSTYRRDREKFGRMRVVQDLKTKGVHPDVINKAVGEIYNEVDERELARGFAERKRLKHPKDQKEAARIFRMMARAGFSTRVIVNLLRNWSVEEETLSALEQEREMAEQAPYADNEE